MASEKMSQQRLLIKDLQGQNLYQRLGLDTGVSDSMVIEMAYLNSRCLLRGCFPEMEDKTAREAAKLIDFAYDTLRDPQRRARYNQEIQHQSQRRWRPTLSSRKRARDHGKENQESAATTESASPSLILNRYRVEELLQEGARAKIFLGTDTKLNRAVIIKSAREEFLKTPEYLQSFRQEAEQFARFSSSHVVKVLDYEPNLAALIMEQLHCDLRSMISDKGCEWSTSVEILTDCLHGLSELHAAGIIHSRMDLSHIMLDSQGAAKLAVTPGMRGEKKTILPGTQSRHLAPELLNPAIFGDPGPNADLYSLGFVVLELLVGKTFGQRVSPSIGNSSNESCSAWLQWHASPTDVLPPINSLVPNLPAAYVDILRRMTCKDQHQRFQSSEKCLLSLREMKTRTEISPNLPSSDDREEPSDSGLDLLGAPAPLHAPYQQKEPLSWARIVREPGLIMTEEALQHRRIVFMGVALTFILILVLLMRSPDEIGESSTAKADQSGQDLNAWPDEIAMDQPADDLPLIDPKQEEAEPEVVQIENTGDRSPFDSPIQQPELCEVNFQVEPTGRILDVRMSVPDQQVVAPDGSHQHHWWLSPGRYSVQYKAGEAEATTTSIDVARGQSFQTFILVAAPPLHAKPAVIEKRALPNHHQRHVPYFEFIATPKISSQGVKSALDRYASNPDWKISNLENNANTDKLSKGDPRIAFAYALMACRQNNWDFAVKQCQLSLLNAKRYEVPFVLPLELLCHLDLQQNGRGLQAALAACREHTMWVKSMADRSGNADFQKVLEDLAWWNGIVVGFAEASSKERVGLEQVDLDYCKSLFLNELDAECADLFNGAIERIEDQCANLERKKKAYQEEFRLRQLQREAGRQERRNDDPVAKHVEDSPSLSSYQDTTEEDQDQVDRSDSSIIPVVKQSYRFSNYHSRFSNYQPRDFSLLASLTRDTIPTESGSQQYTVALESGSADGSSDVFGSRSKTGPILMNEMNR